MTMKKKEIVFGQLSRPNGMWVVKIPDGTFSLSSGLQVTKLKPGKVKAEIHFGQAINVQPA